MRFTEFRETEPATPGSPGQERGAERDPPTAAIPDYHDDPFADLVLREGSRAILRLEWEARGGATFSIEGDRWEPTVASVAEEEFVAFIDAVKRRAGVWVGANDFTRAGQLGIDFTPTRRGATISIDDWDDNVESFEASEDQLAQLVKTLRAAREAIGHD